MEGASFIDAEHSRAARHGVRVETQKTADSLGNLRLSSETRFLLYQIGQLVGVVSDFLRRPGRGSRALRRAAAVLASLLIDPINAPGLTV
jgi:hypothetical protein